MPFESIDEICGRPTLALVHISFSPRNSSSLKRHVSKSVFSGKQFIHVRLFPQDKNSKQRQQSNHTCCHRQPFSCVCLAYISINLQHATTCGARAAPCVVLRCVTGPGVHAAYFDPRAHEKHKSYIRVEKSVCWVIRTWEMSGLMFVIIGF